MTHLSVKVIMEADIASQAVGLAQYRFFFNKLIFRADIIVKSVIIY